MLCYGCSCSELVGRIIGIIVGGTRAHRLGIVYAGVAGGTDRAGHGIRIVGWPAGGSILAIDQNISNEHIMLA